MIYESGKNLLAGMLVAHMSTRQVGVSKLAGMLGISSSYLSQLLSGDKLFASARDDVLRSAAAVLELPPVVAFLLAGRLRHSDFVEPDVSLERELAVAMLELARSPRALEVAVSQDELRQLPRNIQHLLALLHGDATGRPGIMRISRHRDR